MPIKPSSFHFTEVCLIKKYGAKLIRSRELRLASSMYWWRLVSSGLLLLVEALSRPVAERNDLVEVMLKINKYLLSQFVLFFLFFTFFIPFVYLHYRLRL